MSASEQLIAVSDGAIALLALELSASLCVVAALKQLIPLASENVEMDH